MPKWNVHFNTYLDAELPEIVSYVARAHAISAVIRDIPIIPSIKDKLDALNILRAVRGTTGIEGIELTEDEVRRIMESPSKKVLPPNRSREEQEARNARKVMSYVVKELTHEPHIPLTEGLIRTIHKITTRDINYPNNIPGKYRSHDVQAGTYIPPSGRDVGRLMKGFVQWFNTGIPAAWDSIIRAIVAHFYVISIHSFGDGNGRTARGVESFLLYQGRVNARSFYSLANYYYQNRQEYVRYLDYVRFQTNGNLTPFVSFGLKGLVSELQQVHAEVLTNVKSIAFRDYAREQLDLYDKLGSSVGERMSHLLVYLSGGERVSLKAIRSGKHRLSGLYHKLTTKTLSRDINFLKEHELVIVEGDELRANLDIMTLYTPPLESL